MGVTLSLAFFPFFLGWNFFSHLQGQTYRKAGIIARIKSSRSKRDKKVQRSLRRFSDWVESLEKDVHIVMRVRIFLKRLRKKFNLILFSLWYPQSSRFFPFPRKKTRHLAHFQEDASWYRPSIRDIFDTRTSKYARKKLFSHSGKEKKGLFSFPIRNR